jgi:hypothetical protein
MQIWRYGATNMPPYHVQVKSANSDIDNCKNEHPPGQDNSQSQGGFGGNRFAPLNNNNNQGGARSRSGAFGSSMFVPSF